ncbi:hypothetical protein ACXZ1K_08035 [Pedobacter sp. PWIIR3]
MKNTLETFRFLLKFLLLFMAFQTIIISFIGITTPGGFFISWFNDHLNFITLWRSFLIICTAKILQTLGYVVLINATGLKVIGCAGFKIVYSCLGYGISNVLLAFAFAYPKANFPKYSTAILGILCIQILNIVRLCLIAIFYQPAFMVLGLGYHEIFNLFLYIFTISGSYLWIKYQPNN